MTKATRIDGYTVFGDIESRSSWQDKVSFMKAKELDFCSFYSYSVFVPMIFLPEHISVKQKGGMPMPFGKFAVRDELVPADLDLDKDLAPLGMDVAFRLAKYDVVLSSDGSWSDDIPELLKKNPDWIAEVSCHTGEIQYRNSLYAASRARGDMKLEIYDLPSFRPLVVSGMLSWGTKAVFRGYASAFRALGVNVDVFEYDKLLGFYSAETVRRILLGTISDVTKNYTHVVFTDGLSMPPWLLASVRQTKVLISTEDPFWADRTRVIYGYYDAVFTNDRNMAESFGVGYLPTAGDSLLPPVERDKEVDVMFMGAVYPERHQILEQLVEMCRRHGWTCRIVGTKHFDSCSPEFSEVFEERVVPTEEARGLQASARICINLFRSAHCKNLCRNDEFEIESWSLNPRCYDVPLCGSLLLTDVVPEANTVLGPDYCFEDADDLEAKLKKYLSDGELRKEKAEKLRKEVEEGHLYLNRSAVIMVCLQQGFVA